MTRNRELDQCVHEKVLQYGAQDLAESELLAMLLRTDCATSARLVNELGGLRGLEQAGIEELCEIKGIGPKRATVLKAALDLGRRLVAKPLQRGQSFTNSHEVYKAFGPRLSGIEHEEFWAILLNTRNEVLREVKVAQGSINRCPLMPQDLFAPALREKAVSMVILHNHPTGNAEPSSDDRALTRRLVHIGELLGVEILDHLVVGDGRYVSFADRGWL